jgi:hypothetical protein
MAGTDLDAFAPFARRRPAWWAEAACRDRPQPKLHVAPWSGLLLLRETSQHPDLSAHR